MQWPDCCWLIDHMEFFVLYMLSLTDGDVTLLLLMLIYLMAHPAVSLIVNEASPH
jgi:hypothetical protein